MKLKKLKPGMKVEIRWRDSNVPADNWITEEELITQHKRDLLIKSLGYVFKTNKRYLTLYAGTFVTKAWRRRYERIVSIPTKSVVSIKEMGR